MMKKQNLNQLVGLRCSPGRARVEAWRSALSLWALIGPELSAGRHCGRKGSLSARGQHTHKHTGSSAKEGRPSEQGFPWLAANSPLTSRGGEGEPEGDRREWEKEEVKRKEKGREKAVVEGK